MKRAQVIFLVGPTAVGKTGLSIPLAKKIGAQIISCDSMQVYKGMDILSSKPTAAQRAAVAHHLLGIVSPEDEFNVSAYRRRALKAIKTIINRGSIPLFVGGSGLYMSVVVDGIFEVKTEDPRVRARLFRQAREQGSAALHARLQKVDPPAARKIHPNDTRRIVRALEVFAVAGVPISRLQQTRKGLDKEYDVRIIGLDMDRDILYERINRRVEEMFDQGLVKEVKRLLKKKLSRTAACAIGIQEVKSYLEGGLDERGAKELMQRNTRRYARRQMTWFRKDRRIAWVKARPGIAQSVIVQKIVKRNKS
jgi:tRNA dimethylallyltransferase